jgi:hypothetical protein
VTDELGYSVIEGADIESAPYFTGPHIARHDPARVLAEVAAKRRVMARHFTPPSPVRIYAACEGCGYDYGDISQRYDIGDCPELRDMAAVYADHPDYNPAWRVA